MLVLDAGGLDLGRVRSYRDLDVYRLAFDLAIEVDGLTRTLPRHEMYEVGRQIRRSAKSIPANIAEGFGRRRYKQDYIRFIVYALASCDETQVHLDMLYRTNALSEESYQDIREQYNILGRKLNRFLQAIIRHQDEPYR